MSEITVQCFQSQNLFDRLRPFLDDSQRGKRPNDLRRKEAAEESCITPTAVIKQINLLETELGVQLFERTHRGLT